MIATMPDIFTQRGVGGLMLELMASYVDAFLSRQSWGVARDFS